MASLAAVLVPVIGGIISAGIRNERTRKVFYVLLMAVSDVLGILSLCVPGRVTFLSFGRNVSLTFSVDTAGRIFLAAVLILYTAVLVYALVYMKKEEHQTTFFLFFFVSLGAMIAVCAAANLVTVYFAFELATLTSVPLVLHERTREAIAAAMKYLFYSIGGALLGLLGVFFVYHYAGPGTDFVFGGFLEPSMISGHTQLFLAVVFLAILGFGTKAGLYPMHGWLPTAHPIAPAPASSLLSGIIAKAGIIAVIRLVYYSIGPDLLRGTWVQTVWLILAMLTIFMGSMMAFRETVVKKRLAYSTISQISYIMLGLALLTPQGLTGGLLQLLAHMAAKGCLFLCAGVFIWKYGYHHVSELKGIGKRIPIVMWCFTFASLSLIGIPPMGGFTSKWHLALASIGSGTGVFRILGVIVLLISALLTAGYLLPIITSAFFPGKDAAAEEKRDEAPAGMWLPLVALCIVCLLVGLFGSPLLGHLFS